MNVRSQESGVRGRVSGVTYHASRITYRTSRFLLLFAICTLLSACAMPGDAAPVIKIGVIAPFEGTGRPLGYAVLPGIKAAVEEANASGDLGRYRVLVVAFNDALDASTAAGQAQALALDADVLGVVGAWSVETAAAARPILAEAGLPVLVTGWSPVPPLGQKWDDTTLAQAATRVHDDAHTLLDALAVDIRAHGEPTRAGVAAALRSR
jgi:ABC-type branched-subunit amino acid transport system substrate-binding protein